MVFFDPYDLFPLFIFPPHDRTVKNVQHTKSCHPEKNTINGKPAIDETQEDLQITQVSYFAQCIPGSIHERQPVK